MELYGNLKAVLDQGSPSWLSSHQCRWYREVPGCFRVLTGLLRSIFLWTGFFSLHQEISGIPVVIWKSGSQQSSTSDCSEKPFLWHSHSDFSSSSSRSEICGTEMFSTLPEIRSLITKKRQYTKDSLFLWYFLKPVVLTESLQSRFVFRV